jgi:hypothetical protein
MASQCGDLSSLMALLHANEGGEEIDSGGSRNVSDTWSHETVSAEGD